MKVKYCGPLGSGVDVVHPDQQAPDANTVTHCLPGEVVDLPDDVGQAQLDTGLFEAAETRSRKAIDESKDG